MIQRRAPFAVTAMTTQTTVEPKRDRWAEQRIGPFLFQRETLEHR